MDARESGRKTGSEESRLPPSCSAAAGLRAAKKLLKKSIQYLAGPGTMSKSYLIRSTYVVFNSMSRGKLRDILLLAKPPESEPMVTSIAKAIQNGNIELKTLRVDDRGRVGQVDGELCTFAWSFGKLNIYRFV